MKLKLNALFFALLFTITANAQWIPKSNFPGTPKAKSTAFTINNKIYVVGGVNDNSAVLNSFWVYDISTDIWTVKPAFPGPARYGATSFVINGKGYVATGANDFGFLDDLWEYDPATSTWVQKTGLPAGSAQHARKPALAAHARPRPGGDRDDRTDRGSGPQSRRVRHDRRNVDHRGDGEGVRHGWSPAPRAYADPALSET